MTTRLYFCVLLKYMTWGWYRLIFPIMVNWLFVILFSFHCYFMFTMYYVGWVYLSTESCFFWRVPICLVKKNNLFTEQRLAELLFLVLFCRLMIPAIDPLDYYLVHQQFLLIMLFLSLAIVVIIASLLVPLFKVLLRDSHRATY